MNRSNQSAETQRNCYKSVLSCVLIALFLVTASERAVCQGTYDVLATSGNAAPDGNGTFTGFSNFTPNHPILSDAGDVAFHGRLGGTTFGSFDDEGVFKVSSGSPIVQVAREGQSTPFGQGVLDHFTRLSMSDEGELAFWAFSRNAHPSSDTALYRTSNGSLELVVRENGSIPSGGTFYNLFSPVHGIANNLYFVGEFIDTNGAGQGSFSHNAEGLTQIVRSGETLPDGDGVFNSVGTPAVSSSGSIAFRASGTGYFGIFQEDAGVISRVVRSGEAAPDGNGVFDDFRAPVISASQQIAFYATLKETVGGIQNTDNRGIFLDNGVTVLQIARQGQSAVDGNGELRFFGDPRVSTDGYVAFMASHKNTANEPADRYAILRGSETGLDQIARGGQAAPNGVDVFDGFQWPIMNQAGVVAFFATHTGGGRDGLYLADGIDLVEVARSDDLFDGSQITTIGFANATSGRSGLNESGQVAYVANLADGRSEIVLYTPDLNWRQSASGVWNDSDNWTLGIQPDTIHDVYLNSEMALSVLLPSAVTEVRSLTIGGGLGESVLELPNAVTLDISDNLSLLALSTLSFQITGSSDGDFAQVLVAGIAELGGALELDVQPGAVFTPYSPMAVLFADDGIVGEFAVVDGVAVTEDYGLAVTYSSDQVVAQYALLGDANLDGTVDGQDFLLWNSSKFQNGTGWADGDFSGDGITDGQDFLIWNANKFASFDVASAVPEPKWLLWPMMLGVLATCRRVRA